MTDLNEKKPNSGYANNQPGLIWRQRQPLLAAFDIELTERCNNDCIHCCINQPASNGAAQEAELTTEAWKKLLQQGADLGAVTVRFTGGEPLLRSDFVELYLFARHLGLKVMIFTNARLISAELAQLFACIPPLEAIEITVYGMCAKSYTAVSRRRDAFAEFRRGIDLLKQYQIPFFLKGTMLPATKSETPQLQAWANELGIDDVPSLILFLELRHRRDSELRNRLIRKLRLTPTEGLAVLASNPSQYRREMYRLCRQIAGQPTDRLFTCNQCNRICIDAYGRIQFCLALRDPQTVVDSNNYSLAWALSEFFPKLRQRRALDPAYLRRCAKCMLRSLCDQCPAKSWSEHGVLDRPVEYQCEIAHTQARYLGLLQGNEYGWEISDWPQRVLRLGEELEVV